MLPFIYVFGYGINMYWLSAIAGILFTYGFALLRAKNGFFRTSAKDVFFSLLFAIAGARVGGVLFKIIGHIYLYADMPGFWTAEVWMRLLRSGGVFYGGFLGGLLAVLLYVRIRKIDFRDISDILVPAISLFLVFGRLGCFFAGCCYGCEIVTPHGISRIPVQLIEASFSLVIFIAMVLLHPERKRPGILLPLYLMIYSAGRFVLEFFRGDMGRGVFLLSTSQWISLLVFPAGLVLLRWLEKAKRPVA